MQFSLHISLPSMSSLMAPLCPSLPLWVHPYPISPCISMPHMCPLCTPSSPMCPLYPLSIFLHPLHTLSAPLCALLYLFMPYLHPPCSSAPSVWPSMSLHSLHPPLCLSVPFCAPSFPLTSLCPLCTLLGLPLHPFMPCLHLSMSPPQLSVSLCALSMPPPYPTPCSLAFVSSPHHSQSDHCHTRTPFT